MPSPSSRIGAIRGIGARSKKQPASTRTLSYASTQRGVFWSSSGERFEAGHRALGVKEVLFGAETFRHDGPFWRSLASFAAAHAPRVLVRYSPPAWAFAFALAMPGARERVRRNLRWVLGPRPYREEMVDVFRTFSHFASCLTEGLAMGGPNVPEVECVVRGEAHLREALDGGRGAVLVTAHTGGWETAGPPLGKEF